MAIRREQALCLAALALGGLCAWSALSRNPLMPRISSTAKAYEAGGLPIVPLATGNPKAAAGAHDRDLFLEPNESTPLAPRAMPFPALAPWSVVAMPLDPGQQPPAWHQLRLPGTPLGDPFPFSAPAPEGGAEKDKETPRQGPAVGPSGGAVTATSGGQGGLTKQQRIEKYEQLYDRVEVVELSEPYWGEVLGSDRFDLDGRTTVSQPVVMRWINPENGKTTAVEFKVPPEKVARIVLSKALRTQVEIRKRRLSKDVATLPQRAAFLEDLLRAARKDTWVYAVAREQAELYAQIVGGGEDGQRWRARVLAEQGDLEGEWKLYQGLTGDLADSAFKWCGIGEIQARIGLGLDAEESLTKAVQKAPADPRCHDALARFLCARGRPAEAVPHAEAALRNKGMVQEQSQVFGFAATMLGCQLALGRIDAAKDAFAKLEALPELTGKRDLLKGALEYAAGNREAGLQALQTASDGGGGAALAQAACLIAVADPATGKWAEAKALLETVRDTDPLLRHRAHAGLALLYERTLHPAEAVAAAEAAYQANPRDPYVLYLLGRERRLGNQPDLAIEPLQRALRGNDTMVEGCVELALAELALAQAQGSTEADLHRARALKLIDRAVDLEDSRGPTLALLEIQGRIAFEAGDVRAARAAFARGSEKSTYCRIGVALCDYASNKVEEARGQLASLVDKLKRGEPLRDHAETLLRMVDDWSAREQIRETFDRPDLQKGERGELSKKWDVGRNAGLGPVLLDNALRITGEVTTAGKPVYARKKLERSGNFIRTEVFVVVNGDQRDRFYGLTISDEGRASGQVTVHDFEMRFGVRDGKPFLRISDGDARGGKAELFDPVALPETCRVEIGKPIHLEVEAETRKESDQAFVLRCYWDGVLVHERDVARISRSSRPPLMTDLTAEGPVHQPLDVAFDDYRLVRRRAEK